MATEDLRRRRARRRLRLLAVLPALLLAVSGCAARRVPVAPALSAASAGDTLALSDALEQLIAAGQDTPADREYAYEQVRAREENTAAGDFGRAAIIGRFVEQHGLTKATLLAEVERAARRSRELDPRFRDGAATRMLGTLYVIAPAALLAHGNSETGLELLEGLAKARPEVPENQLRLGEAYLALGDSESAVAPLCACRAAEARLRRDERALLQHLMSDAGVSSCP